MAVAPWIVSDALWLLTIAMTTPTPFRDDAPD